MNQDELLRKLAARARQETIPEPDVAERVCERIEGISSEATFPSLLVAAAAAAAVVALVYAVQTWSDLGDPFRELVLSLNVVLQ